jgi:hypothetical protein
MKSGYQNILDNLDLKNRIGIIDGVLLKGDNVHVAPNIEKIFQKIAQGSLYVMLRDRHAPYFDENHIMRYGILSDLYIGESILEPYSYREGFIVEVDSRVPNKIIVQGKDGKDVPRHLEETRRKILGERLREVGITDEMVDGRLEDMIAFYILT